MIFKENNELNLAMQSKFITRNEKSLIYERLIATHLGLPGLTGFWPMANIDAANNGDVWSLSGGDKTLTNNNNTPINVDGILPYMNFTSSSSQYLERLDEASLRISGIDTFIDTSINGMTFGGMFLYKSFTDLQMLMQKIVVANASGQFRLLTDITPNVFATIYGLPATTTATVTNTEVLVVNQWYCIIAKYDKSSDTLKIFVNGSSNSSSTLPITSIQGTSAPFRIGAQGNNTRFLNGYATNCFLCAASIDDATIKYISSLSLELVR